MFELGSPSLWEESLTNRSTYAVDLGERMGFMTCDVTGRRPARSVMTRAGAGSAAVSLSKPPMFTLAVWEAQWMQTTSSPFADSTMPSLTPTSLSYCLISQRLSKLLQSERPEEFFSPYDE